jgi:hypothetical protein
MQMKIPLPDLEFGPNPDRIRTNRDEINAAIELYKGAIKTLEGLAAANAGMCKHPNKSARYDPGYAGGGYSHSECPTCGARLP